MKAPIFRAKDKDSDQWVEGFYVEFPSQRDVDKCPMVHAIMVVVPDENSLSPNDIEKVPNELIEVVDNFTVNGEGGYRLAQLNTLVYCTIDISTLKKVGEVEIGHDIFCSLNTTTPKRIKMRLKDIFYSLKNNKEK